MTYYRIQDYPATDLLDGPQVSYSYLDESAEPRSGKSVMDSYEGLVAYMATVGIAIDWDNAILVELDGTYSDDEDEDAAHGAELIHPTEIIAVTPLDETSFFADVDAYLTANAA